MTWCCGCDSAPASILIRTGQHTAATRMLRDGVPIEIVSTLLGHASVTTTLDIYGHLTAEDARRVLERAGWFTNSQVQL